MPSGARKGERRGGRAAGVPNKLSSTRVEWALQEGRRLPPESLLLLAEEQLAMAARYRPEITADAADRRTLETGGK
jgi:hypothetical protein